MYLIGDIIKTKRKQLGKTQEELAFGTCSTSTLSRIENGDQMPSRKVVEDLLFKLGLDPSIYILFQNENELQVNRLKHEINQKLIKEQYDEVEMLLEKFEKLLNVDKEYEQFIEYIRAILLRRNGGDPQEVLAAVLDVAKVTIADVSIEKIRKLMLTRDELSILNNLAIAYYDIGNTYDARNLLYTLKDYIEHSVVDDDGISPLYTAILYNLSKWVGLEGLYSETIKLCDIGILRCIEYGVYFSFSLLLYNKGYALVMLNRKEEAIKYVQEAYYIDRARGRMQLCEHILQFAKKHEIIL